MKTIKQILIERDDMSPEKADDLIAELKERVLEGEDPAPTLAIPSGNLIPTDGLSPMMRQYANIRNGLPSDVILFFRLGDFYETFFGDAKTAASILELALTKRKDIPMAGIPLHAKESYIKKLIAAGYRVALADNPEELLLDECGLEPDYVFELLEP